MLLVPEFHNPNLRYDSRNRFYKSVPGAVRAGDGVRLRLSLPGDAGYGDVLLALRRDEAKEPEYLRLSPVGQMDGRNLYEITVQFPEVGLYWYHFEYDSEWRRHYIFKGAYNREFPEGAPWQQTVYDPALKTPDWLPGGVIYQIFPDRFYPSGTPKSHVPEDRFLRQDWGGQPACLQTGPKPHIGEDYFGGDLRGIAEKLSYLKSLGVTALYLNPVFEAHSNHRYNTADYLAIDPLLGDEADFQELCELARQYGIRVILDGVFSHTGDDSRYFNRYGRYPQPGAYQSQDSPCFGWYRFESWPDEYKAWWGVPSLPEVQEEAPEYLEFITGPKGVLRRWLRAGASGWRLDVADELPDGFLDALRLAVKEENSDALILGEVWEDASNKISYGSRRRFLLGAQLDSVMNYPFADAILRFAKGGAAQEFAETVQSILEHYPAPVIPCLMNHIGTHDTARALTVLGGEDGAGRTREWQAAQRLSPEEWAAGKRRLLLASVLQYTLPGVPSLYYGDEAGMSGWGDPFCRGCYPWGQEDEKLLAHYRLLGEIRNAHPVFADGGFRLLKASGGLLAYLRQGEGASILVAANAGTSEAVLPLPGMNQPEVLAGIVPDGEMLRLPPLGFSVIEGEGCFDA